MTRKQHTKLLRKVRKLHRVLGISLGLWFFIIAISGLVLGWKKNSQGLILPPTCQGTSTNTEHWLSIDSLRQIAIETLKDSCGDIPVRINRIDVRPEKGMVKFIFAYRYWGIQVDGASGKILSVRQRWSDMVENIHDGSIIDYLLNTGSGVFKLIYTSLMGLSLFVFVLSGFWLWYAPKIIRRLAINSEKPEN